MKLFFIIFSLLLLCGCGQVDRLGAEITGYSKSCVDGIEYLQFTSGVTVAYSQDGKS